MALALLLALILVSAGTGAAASRQLIAKPLNIEKCLVAILLMVIVFYLANAPILRAFETKSALWKVAASAILVGPLFFTMGFPFPLLLGQVKQRGGVDSFPWMIGINSITTLLGGVLAIWVAMQGGYRFVLLSGAGLYALLLFWLLIARRWSVQAQRPDYARKYGSG